MGKIGLARIFEDKRLIKNATPAQMLQKILKDKWSLSEDDKDMIVMWINSIIN